MSTKRASYNLGNQYAKKYEKPLNDSLSLRCNATEKHHWQVEAEREGLSLNQWVIEKLNLALNRVT